MKEGQPLGEPQKSLRRRVNPKEEAFVLGASVAMEVTTGFAACHSFTHEHPVQGLIQLFGASVLALALAYRANQLARKINTLSEQLPNQEQGK
jgi:hypothetical protein